MSAYVSKSKAELQSLYEQRLSSHRGFIAAGKKLDMSRGKPSKAQLDLSQGMLTRECPHIARDGLDCRNYGQMDGLPEMKELFGALLNIPGSQIVISGNSSLQMMFDCIALGMTHGYSGCEPWMKQDKIKFLCPVPGYDRHFTIIEYFGAEMIPVRLNGDGPDMDTVRRLAESDAQIKGIWCVPRYSNPDGLVYSDEVVRAFAALKPAAPDFRIMWDDAYFVHNFKGERAGLLNIFDACRETGSEDMPLMFASFSKVSFPGGAVSMAAASPRNIEAIKKRIFSQTIGPDKLNQLRHVNFFKDAQGVLAHMKKQAQIVRPHFDLVLNTLDARLGDKGIGRWSRPEGGYFISFYALEGCAKRIAALCLETGLVITPAGATYPYGKDPYDSNIRIAPTFPSLEELAAAVDTFINAVELASIEKLLK